MRNAGHVGDAMTHDRLTEAGVHDRQLGQHDEFAPRYVEADVLQIVFARAPHADEVLVVGHAVD